MPLSKPNFRRVPVFPRRDFVRRELPPPRPLRPFRENPETENKQRIKNTIQPVRQPQNVHRHRRIARAAKNRVEQKYKNDNRVSAEVDEFMEMREQWRRGDLELEKESDKWLS